MARVVTFTINPSVDISTSATRIEPTHKLRCRPARHDPGGGGVNVARAIRRLGGDSLALYPTGGGVGQLLRRLLDDEGVASRTVDVEAETHINFSAFDRTSREQYRFVMPGAKLVQADWQACLDCAASLDPAPEYIVASGSLPPGVPDDFYARLARLARDRGTRMVLDTSGPGLGAALAEKIHLIKPNLRELGDLVDRPLRSEFDWREAADELVATGRSAAVALTLGKDGAYLTTQDLHLRAPGLPVEASSAIGAGDCFLAGMVWRLAEGDGYEDAFRWAMAAGAATLLTPGTELCRKADVERLCRQVRLLAN